MHPDCTLGVRTLPVFPVDALPYPLGMWVEAEALATQTPPDLAAMLALTTLATILAKRVVVEVRSGWIEPVNIFTIAVLASGERKSPVERDTVAPIREFELELARARKKGQRLRRLLADDATPEALVELLAAQDGRIGLISAEGGIFETIAGRYARGVPNLDAILKAHSGDPIYVDRVSRGPLHVSNPALTLGLAVQPAVLARLLDHEDKSGFRGRGLLARFLFAVPKSLVGEREVDPAPMPDELRTWWHDLCRWLLQEEDQRKGDEIIARRFTLDPEAYKALLDFSEEIERRLREAGDLKAISDWTNKLAGTVVRIAGLLRMVDCPDCTDSAELMIGAEHFQNSIKIARYLIEHAKRVFQIFELDPNTEGAKRILRWIRTHRKMRFSKRQAFDAMRSFGKASALDRPLELLCEAGYIRRLDLPERGGPGRRRSPLFDVLPHTHNTQNPHNEDWEGDYDY